MSVPTGPSDQATFAATVVDEWAALGVRDAVICPGSRSTPLALALAAAAIRLHVRLDERSAGFYALGLSLATGQPTVVCTTSGTAAAELHPAVLEAHHSCVPLLVCTADRPPELQDVGAPQTVDQVHLFGRAVRWFTAPDTARADTASSWRPLAARAYVEAVGGPAGPGPVHLNLGFREPLVGAPGPLPPRRQAAGARPAPSHLPQHHDVAPSPGELLARWGHWSARRGALVVGEGCGPARGVLELARALGWPVLADPRSGCRIDDPLIMAGADAFLRDPTIRRALLPEVVLVLGSSWASKPLAGWLADASSLGAQIVAVDPWWRWTDPDHVTDTVVRADPEAWVAALRVAFGADRPGGRPGRQPDGPGGDPHAGNDRGAWLETWVRVELATQASIDTVLGLVPSPGAGTPGTGPPAGMSEPEVARSLFGMVPHDCRLLVSSSMPVRDFESFAPPVPAPPRVFANRGVNGIDGVSSTALGLAAAGSSPVVCVLGDLAFLHDVSALVRSAGPAHGSSCTFVVVDNAGGGIFSFLAQADALEPDDFELLFGTPQSPDVLEVAAGFGLPVAEAASSAELASALSRFVGQGVAVVRARMPSRSENLALHHRLFTAAGAAAKAVLP